MKMLRQITVFLALVLAPVAFCATITANTAITYTDGGVVKTLAAGDTLTVADGSTFDLVRGTATVVGTASVDAGNGIAKVTDGTMVVPVKGDRSSVKNTGDSGKVSFTKPSGAETEIAAGAAIAISTGDVDTVIVAVDDSSEIPDVDTIGTPL